MNHHPCYALIKTLSKNEKRYFKLSRIHSGELIYQKLFDYLDNTESPSDKQINSITKEYGSVTNPSIHKNYLQKILLDTMVKFNKGTALGNQLAYMYLEIEYLFSKNLNDQVRKKIISAKHKSLLYEEFEFFLQFIDWERRAFSNKWTTQERIEWQEKRTAIVSKIQLIQECSALSDQLFCIIQNMQRLSPVEKKEIQKEIARIQSSDNHTFKSQDEFLSARLFSQQVFNDGRQEIEISRKIITLYQTFPHFLHSKLSYYIKSIHNHLGACLREKRYEEFNKYMAALNDIKTIKNASEANKQQAQVSYYLYFMFYCILKGEFRKCARQLDSIIKEWQSFRYAEGERQRVWLAVCSSVIYYANGDHKKSLRTIHIILNDLERRKISPIFLHTLETLRLVIYYELKNHTQLFKFVNLNEKFVTEKSLAGIHSILVKYFKHLARPDKISEKKILLSFQKELQKLFSQANYKESFSVFSLLFWIKAQLQNKRYAQVVKENQ